LFDAISEDAERKSLARRHGFFLGGTVRQHTWYVYNLGNPAPIGLKFCFDFVHYVRHVRIVARSSFCGIKLWLDFPKITGCI
jgi:hypothetical protein